MGYLGESVKNGLKLPALLGSKESHRTTTCTSILRTGHVLNTAQQLELVKSYKAKEIKVVMFNIGNTRSPWPDGYGSDFFKVAWDIIGADITKAVLEFFENGKLLTQLCNNHSFDF